MPKNIVILLDGTSNEISSNRTNILRLYGTLEKSAAQIVYYNPGVGTFGPENGFSYASRKTAEIIGMATGWGIDQNVKEAYRFLVENYDDGKRPGDAPLGRDEIFIFGFSRGAYSARVLAGFINALGLVSKSNLNLIKYAYRAYKGITKNANDVPDWAEMDLYNRILNPDHPPIRCLGLFDTVASVIEFGRFRLQFRSHVGTSRNPSVAAVRHAVAMDERRNLFQPLLWVAGQPFYGNRFKSAVPRPQDSRELWFAGVHGDVGGGYPEDMSALAKVPLDWMIRETGPMGLAYKALTVNELVLGTNPKKKYVKPDALAAANQSMNAAWAMLEYVPRRVSRTEKGERKTFFGWYLPLFNPRRIRPDAILHTSVQHRVAQWGLPPNAPADPVYES